MLPARTCAAILAATLVIVITAPALADPEPASAATDPAPSPPMQEIQQLLAAARAELADLQAAYRAASGAERDDLERRISDLKTATEIGVLEIQLRHAEAAGRDDDALRLRESISALRGDPRPKSPPRTRAAPGAGR